VAHTDIGHRTSDIGHRTDLGHRISAILYDHDGTLVNSLPVVVAATNGVLAKNGYPIETPEVVIAAMVLATAPRMGHHARVSDPLVQRRLAAEFYEQARILGPRLATAYDGIAELLAVIAGRGIAQGVISNNQGEVVRIIVKHLGLSQHLALTYGEDDVSSPKPHPAGIHQAAAALGVSLDRILFVGDSENDSEAAQAAGVRSVGVTWGIHARDKLMSLNFDHVIDHPRELLALVE
jgi:phosphoglycolate phosphatase